MYYMIDSDSVKIHSLIKVFILLETGETSSPTLSSLLLPSSHASFHKKATKNVVTFLIMYVSPHNVIKHMRFIHDVSIDL